MAGATSAGRVLSFSKEATFGTSPAAGTGKVIPRVSHSLGLQIKQVESKEIRPDLQKGETRNGFRSVEGDIKGELSAGMFTQFFAAICRKAFTATKVAPLVAKTGTPANEKTANYTYIPATGHTSDSFTFEDWWGDLGAGAGVLFNGCKVESIEFDIKGDDSTPVGISIGFVGKDGAELSTRYFTAPTSLTQSAKITALNGALKADGVDAIITDAKIKIKVDSKAAAVVGQNSTPDICLGSVEVSGSLSAYFTDTSLRAKSLADAPMSLAIRLDVSREDVMSDYVTIILPAVKLSLPKINDGDTCLQTDIDFTAFPAVYGSVPATTLIIQDTLA